MEQDLQLELRPAAVIQRLGEVGLPVTELGALTCLPDLLAEELDKRVARVLGEEVRGPAVQQFDRVVHLFAGVLRGFPVDAHPHLGGGGVAFELLVHLLHESARVQAALAQVLTHLAEQHLGVQLAFLRLHERAAGLDLGRDQVPQVGHGVVGTVERHLDHEEIAVVITPRVPVRPLDFQLQVAELAVDVVAGGVSGGLAELFPGQQRVHPSGLSQVVGYLIIHVGHMDQAEKAPVPGTLELHDRGLPHVQQPSGLLGDGADLLLEGSAFLAQLPQTVGECGALLLGPVQLVSRVIQPLQCLLDTHTEQPCPFVQLLAQRGGAVLCRCRLLRESVEVFC